MKKIIRSIFIPVFIAIICGYIGGKYVYNTYKNNLYNNLNSSKLYLAINGEYDDINSMREENSSNNYIYYKDDDKYKSVVGITKEYDNIDKIKLLYNDKIFVYVYYLPNDILNDKQEEYEKMLGSASDTEDIKEAVDNILSLYRNDDNIRLIGIN